jgi:hypothetical protein
MNIDNGNLSNSKSTPLWQMKNGHGDHWLNARVNYEGNNQSITNFLIEGYASYDSKGDIALGLCSFNFSFIFYFFLNLYKFNLRRHWF